MSMPKPFFKSKNTAVVAGVTAMGVGWFCLRDAWEGRGGNTPWWARPFTWW